MTQEDPFAASRSLIQALGEVKTLRFDFSRCKANASQVDEILERTEVALQRHAEKVLSSACAVPNDENPAFRKTAFRRARPSWQKRMQHKQLDSQAGRQKMRDPHAPLKCVWETINPASDAGRRWLSERFGVPESTESPVDPETCSSSKGTLRRGLASAPGTLLPVEYRSDPLVLIPAHIPETLAHKGVLHLTNQRVLPPFGDLTDTLNGDGGMIAAGPSPLHPFACKHIRGHATTAMQDAVMQSQDYIKLDMLTPVVPPTAPRSPEHRLRRIAVRDGELAAEGPAGDEPDASSGSPGSSQQVPAPPEARGYEMLMDDLALHEFMIRKGLTVDTTPEFASFHRTYSEHWLTIAQVILQLELIAGQYAVPLAVVDGTAVAAVAEAADMRGIVPRMEDLLACVKNIQEVAAILSTPGRRFQGPTGKDLAATAIQGAVKGFLTKARAKRHGRKGSAAKVIQTEWRARKLRQQLQEALAGARSARDQRFSELQSFLADSWGEIHTRSRVLVHVPTVDISSSAHQRITSTELRAAQNSQIARICDIADDQVDVIFVCARPLEDEVMEYWQQLLEVAGVPEASTRFRVVCPENVVRLPGHLSLTQQLLASPRAMKRIGMYIRGRPAYIVPGEVSDADIDLAVHLGLPLVGPHPSTAAALSSKSAGRALFAAAAVNVAPGCALPPVGRGAMSVAVSPLKSGTSFEFLPGGKLRVTQPDATGRPVSVASAPEYDALLGRGGKRRKDEFLIDAIAEMMVSRPATQRWLIKLDNEFNGRGHAHVDISAIRGVEDALMRYTSVVDAPRLEGDQTSAIALQEGAAEVALFKICDALREHLPKRLVIAAPGVYTGYKAYVEAARSQGVVLEAYPLQMVGSPTVNLFVEPGGTVRVLSTHEQLCCPAYRAVGHSFPQASVPSAALCDASISVGMAAHAAGIIGHLEVDYVALRDGNALRLWGVDINLGASSSLNTFQLFDFLVDGEFDPFEGAYTVSVPPELPAVLDPLEATPPPEEILQRRYYLSVDHVHHPGLQILRYGHLFHQCRNQGFCFDVQQRLGTTFNLFDSLLGGCLGLQCCALTPHLAFQEMADALDFLDQQVADSENATTALKTDRTFHRLLATVHYLAERLKPPSC